LGKFHELVVETAEISCPQSSDFKPWTQGFGSLDKRKAQATKINHKMGKKMSFSSEYLHMTSLSNYMLVPSITELLINWFFSKGII